jgi:hypothetical protein
MPLRQSTQQHWFRCTAGKARFTRTAPQSHTKDAAAIVEILNQHKI